MSTDKVVKPALSGEEKVSEKDEGKFHFIYVLKKQGSALPPPKPVEEQSKEDKEDNA